jgi:hypothetical protein
MSEIVAQRLLLTAYFAAVIYSFFQAYSLGILIIDSEI